MRAAIVISLIVISFSIGLFWGYRAALDNQLYYDAPAKIVLYSKLLDTSKSEEYLHGQITQQVQILNENELSPSMNHWLVYLPPHGREFKETYNYHFANLSTNMYYKEALSSLCKYGGNCK